MSDFYGMSGFLRVWVEMSDFRAEANELVTDHMSYNGVSPEGVSQNRAEPDI